VLHQASSRSLCTYEMTASNLLQFQFA
jgi:hypothetical protein